jgi:3D-(3,5/4)-trihydroxycyclohexane-1,2-dione acylhydrolase (decyclizing)
VAETDASVSVPGYDSWWDVAVAEVSQMESVREARARYEEARKRERHFV